MLYLYLSGQLGAGAAAGITIAVIITVAVIVSIISILIGIIVRNTYIIKGNTIYYQCMLD